LLLSHLRQLPLSVTSCLLRCLLHVVAR